ncbi:unnamed protein product [Peniophora sp. CBMAI 1063]|nr:unnamed protein product [Peniophora sp. CBMAI 1063]
MDEDERKVIDERVEGDAALARDRSASGLLKRKREDDGEGERGMWSGLWREGGHALTWVQDGREASTSGLAVVEPANSPAPMPAEPVPEDPPPPNPTNHSPFTLRPLTRQHTFDSIRTPKPLREADYVSLFPVMNEDERRVCGRLLAKRKRGGDEEEGEGNAGGADVAALARGVRETSVRCLPRRLSLSPSPHLLLPRYQAVPAPVASEPAPVPASAESVPEAATAPTSPATYPAPPSTPSSPSPSLKRKCSEEDNTQQPSSSSPSAPSPTEDTSNESAEDGSRSKRARLSSWCHIA